MDKEAIQSALWEVIQEQLTPEPIEISARWKGGIMTLKPNNDTQPKDIPLEIFFKKLIGMRESLRVLDQKITGSTALSQEEKLGLHTYITRCYGSLTTFNILFKDDKHRFVGAGKTTKGDSQKDLTLGQAKRKLGLNEY